MVHSSLSEFQIASVAACLAIASGAALWWLNHERPTPDELEQERRQTLFNFGRIVDGMLLDGFQVTAEDGSSRDMLLYQYEISGVSYECSQDITPLRDILNPAEVKLGMPCSIRYQPGSPENSILVAERWSGLREGVSLRWPSAPDHRRDDDLFPSEIPIPVSSGEFLQDSRKSLPN
jgi:hypothetical protein